MKNEKVSHSKVAYEKVAVLELPFEYTAFGSTFSFAAGEEIRFKGRRAPKLYASGIVLPVGRDVDVVIPRSAYVLYTDEIRTVTTTETSVTRTQVSGARRRAVAPPQPEPPL